MASVTTTQTFYEDILDKCVACGIKEIKFWRTKHFQYTEKQKNVTFTIYRCAHCKTGFLNQPPNRQWLNEIYQYSGQALTKPASLDEILAREAESPNCMTDAERMSKQAHQFNQSGNQKALDIGSGFGFYTKAIRQLGYCTVSINPGQYENQVFKELNGYEPVPVMLESFEHTGRFGVVIMSQVLEHILEPDSAIKKASILLERGGVLACAVPNFNSFSVKLFGTRDNACLWVPEHVNYFTANGLKALFERHGLQVVKLEQVTRIPLDALSRRLGLTGKSATLINSFVKFAQVPFSSLMNFFGLGIYVNLYAVKK